MYIIWCLKVPQVVSQGARIRGTLRHFFENRHLLLKYTPLNAVSICVVKKCFISKTKYIFRGFLIVPSQGAPVSPTMHVRIQINKM